MPIDYSVPILYSKNALILANSFNKHGSNIDEFTENLDISKFVKDFEGKSLQSVKDPLDLEILADLGYLKKEEVDFKGRNLIGYFLSNENFIDTSQLVMDFSEVASVVLPLSSLPNKLYKQVKDELEGFTNDYITSIGDMEENNYSMTKEQFL